MNDDLISRSDIKDHISELMLVYKGTELNNAILNAIDNTPTVLHDNYSMGYQDGVRKVLSERPHGEWIPANGTYYCSCCKHYAYESQKFDFCQDCGVDMREEDSV